LQPLDGLLHPLPLAVEIELGEVTRVSNHPEDAQRGRYGERLEELGEV
jgi:hypothetical protein